MDEHGAFTASFVLELVIGLISLAGSLFATIRYLLAQIENAKKEAMLYSREECDAVSNKADGLQREVESTHTQLGAFNLEYLRGLREQDTRYQSRADAERFEARIMLMLDKMSGKIDQLLNRDGEQPRDSRR